MHFLKLHFENIIVDTLDLLTLHILCLTKLKIIHLAIEINILCKLSFLFSNNFLLDIEMIRLNLI